MSCCYHDLLRLLRFGFSISGRVAEDAGKRDDAAGSVLMKMRKEKREKREKKEKTE